MSIQEEPVLEPEDLNDADEAILDELHDGRGTPKFIAERTGTDRSYVSQRLKRLQEHGHVDRLETGLYELVEDPRAEEGDQKTNVSTEDVVDDYLWEHYGFGVDDLEDQLADQDELRDTLADAREAYENVNGNGVEDALDRMEELLDGE